MTVNYEMAGYTILTALSLLAILLLSPLCVEVVNLFRPRDRQLISSEEIADAYDAHVCKIFICSACQTFWATVAAAYTYAGAGRAGLTLFFLAYGPTLVLWLCVKKLYREFN